MEKYPQSYAYSTTFQRRVHVLHPFVKFLERVDPVDLFQCWVDVDEQDYLSSNLLERDEIFVIML